MGWFDDLLGSEDSYDTSTLFDGYSPGGDNTNIETSLGDFDGYDPGGDYSNLDTSNLLSGNYNPYDSYLPTMGNDQLLADGAGLNDQNYLSSLTGGLSGLANGVSGGLSSLLSSGTLKGLLGTGLALGQVAGAFQGNDGSGSNAQVTTPQVDATPMTWRGTGAPDGGAKHASYNNDFTNAWNTAFEGKQEGFAPGQTIDWGGGKLTNNSGKFNYQKQDGSSMTFDQNSNPYELAKDPQIYKQWHDQYGDAAPTPKAQGGGISGQPTGRPQGALGLLKGASSGQKDDVPINASHGEYVMDADTVASLGDGNTDAGAAKLDQMREKIRSHKRSAPSNKIPPKAKDPMAYLKGRK